MMRFALALGLTIATLASPVAAQNLLGCSKSDARIVSNAMESAKALTLKAAARIGDTPEYERWFGTYTNARSEIVRANLKSIVTAMRNGGVTVQCHRENDASCSDGEYAFVYPDRPYEVHVCASFFTLPPLTALRPGERRSNNGTREGTMVHEISHFTRVADTDDHCYSRSECADMARDDAVRAIDNADSYQYFTEDVTYYARQPIANKPPRAAQP